MDYKQPVLDKEPKTMFSEFLANFARYPSTASSSFVSGCHSVIHHHQNNMLDGEDSAAHQGKLPKFGYTGIVGRKKRKNQKNFKKHQKC